ncbi:MAG: hypothetical protein ACRCYL_06165 [Kluyvera sp.]
MPIAATPTTEPTSFASVTPITERAARHEHTCYRHAQRSSSVNPELTLIVSSVHKRDPRYVAAFREGRARWYHMPVSTSRRQGMFTRQMAQIRYCAVAVPVNDPTVQKAFFVYPVLSIRLTAREKLSREQTGSQTPPAQGEQQYWLFELGEAIRLPQAVIKPNTTAFYFRLTQLSALQQGLSWARLPAPDWHHPAEHTTQRNQANLLLVRHTG